MSPDWVTVATSFITTVGVVLVAGVPGLFAFLQSRENKKAIAQNTALVAKNTEVTEQTKEVTKQTHLAVNSRMEAVLAKQEFEAEERRKLAVLVERLLGDARAKEAAVAERVASDERTVIGTAEGHAAGLSEQKLKP